MNKHTAAKKLIGDFAPKLVELTDGLLFHDVWERQGLSNRSRTVTVLSGRWPGALPVLSRSRRCC